MARVVVYLLDPEMSALNQLAEQEYRPVRAQAALIIRNELKRLGMVETNHENSANWKTSQDGAARGCALTAEPVPPAESEA